MAHGGNDSLQADEVLSACTHVPKTLSTSNSRLVQYSPFQMAAGRFNPIRGWSGDVSRARLVGGKGC
jgi:hypothetical protein